jgi:Domain of unknown function (DUF1841)
MFAPTRDQARQFLFETWRKYRAGEPLLGLEQSALAVILLHPEYHALLERPERYRDRDYGPDSGQLNPFLHLSLHLAVAEQLSIDQPPGIRARYEKLVQRTSEHEALHVVLECLGETLWQAQRLASAPDQEAYLACLDRHTGTPNKKAG